MTQKKKHAALVLPLCMAALVSAQTAFPVSALRIQGPEQALFARPTSDTVIRIPAEEPEYDADDTEPLWDSAAADEELPEDFASEKNSREEELFSYTPVTAGLYGKDGRLGRLYAAAIGMDVPVYEGTGAAQIARGAGHFSGTSIWNGNAAFAAHNRGVTNHFGRIHQLKRGNRICYQTKLGTRTYRVTSVRKISVRDVSVLEGREQNMLTLVTCVRNQPQVRWCVRAEQLPDR